MNIKKLDIESLGKGKIIEKIIIDTIKTLDYVCANMAAVNRKNAANDKKFLSRIYIYS